MAEGASAPHISCDGRKPPQKAGRSGRPKMRQRISSSSCTQGTPAGLPSGMPGIGLVMEGAMQHAPQRDRQLGAGRRGIDVTDDMGRLSARVARRGWAA